MIIMNACCATIDIINQLLRLVWKLETMKIATFISINFNVTWRVIEIEGCLNLPIRYIVLEKKIYIYIYNT